MKKGFATIYIVLILFSFVLAVMVITEVTSGFAAQSVAESICTSAGESVLGMYNQALFKRYGIFAVANDEMDLLNTLSKYIDWNCKVTKGFVRINAKEMYVYADEHPCLNIDLFLEELNKIAPESIAKIRKGIEAKDERKLGSIKLPSKQLGYSNRESVILSGGIFDFGTSTLLEDEYIMKMCSSCNALLEDSYLAYEIEYILFGNDSDQKNIDSMRRSIYSVRLAVNIAKADPPPVDATSLAIVSAKAAIVAEKETRMLMNGEKVDGLYYPYYLRAFLALLDKEEKLARLMDIMQINLNYMDGTTFSFKNYSFGFDIIVEFEKKVFVPIYWGNGQRKRTVEQTHRYK